MKIHLTLVALTGLFLIRGAFAGPDDYCPPDKGGKCPVDCCPDNGGSITFGYGSDYIHYGNRLAGDHMWADVNYTFEEIFVPITLGVKHISSLGSNVIIPTAIGAPFQATDDYGDETRLYATINLPSYGGFESSLTYTHYLYPTARPSRNPNTNLGFIGDSASELSLDISRHLLCGVTLSYRGAFDFTNPSSRGTGAGAAPVFGQNDDRGAWIHELGLEKGICITDCVSLDLSGGVVYSDNYWSNNAYYDEIFPRNNPIETVTRSGFNNYYLKAALPIALNCRATLTPYIAYNGSPDGWVSDGLLGVVTARNLNATQQSKNANDVLHGGVSIKVDF